MAVTDYIGIRGLASDDTLEVFQGIGSSVSSYQTQTQSSDERTLTPDDTGYDFNNDDWGLDAPTTLDDLPELLKRAFFYNDGEVLMSIFKKAWLYQDPDDPIVRSILEKALLYVKNADGKHFLESILKDGLADLAFVDAMLDFGFVRIHIKGKMIEY